MRKNKFFMLGIITVFVAILSLTFVSSTFARYTSTVSGSDSARVAKWNLEYNDVHVTNAADNVNTQVVTFDLFNTVKDTKDGNTETDIQDSTGTLVAPGTKGSFSFVLENLSEVNATYAIDYKVTNSNNIPIKFRVQTNGGAFSEWTSDIADVVATNIAMTNGKATILIEWQWVYGDDSVEDTTLGIGGTASVEVEAVITFVQVD